MQPSISATIIYQGNDTAAEAYHAAFRALAPALETTQSDISWGALHDVGGFGHEGPGCQGGKNALLYPNSFDRWDPAALRAGYELFAEALTSEPQFAPSYWIFESYGRKGPQLFPADYSAVPPEERAYHLLTGVVMQWEGAAKKKVVREATTYGKAIREVTRSTVTPAHTYVNYSPEDPASLGEMYGRDEARLEKLRGLKAKWDPQNQFGFYQGIAGAL